MGMSRGKRLPCTMSISMSVTLTNSPWNVTRSIRIRRRTTSTISRIACSGFCPSPPPLGGQRPPPPPRAPPAPPARAPPGAPAPPPPAGSPPARRPQTRAPPRSARRSSRRGRDACPADTRRRARCLRSSSAHPRGRKLVRTDLLQPPPEPLRLSGRCRGDLILIHLVRPPARDHQLPRHHPASHA